MALLREFPNLRARAVEITLARRTASPKATGLLWSGLFARAPEIPSIVAAVVIGILFGFTLYPDEYLSTMLFVCIGAHIAPMLRELHSAKVFLNDKPTAETIQALYPNIDADLLEKWKALNNG